MRSQTGGTMSFGWGVLHGRSSKQKLNTKSSTEAELVGMSEYLPYNIWLLNFLHAQGCKVHSNILKCNDIFKCFRYQSIYALDIKASLL